jgi:LysR family nitrogen assimilation transcriptional regulator
MNLKQLEYFVRVAENGSFSKAALVLKLAQPALSRQVRLLETDLRVTLLKRTGRGVELTEAGRRLFEHGVDILQRFDQAREDLEASRDEPTGRIVIGLPPSLGRQLTVPLVAAVKAQLPRARMSIVEGLSAHLGEWIASGRVDVGLLYNPEPHAGIEAQPLLEEPLCLVSPMPVPALKTAGGSIRLERVATLPLVLPERSHSMRHLLETQALRAGYRLEIAWEVSSVPAILELVRAGHGHAVLTRSAVAVAPQPEAFQIRPIHQPALTTALCLGVSSQRPATPVMRHAVRLLRELLLRHGAGVGVKDVSGV